MLDGYPVAKVRVLNFDNVLCDAQRCPIVKNGESLYFDANHLSVFGAKLLVPTLTLELSEIGP
jgi:hypothetical protein